MFSKYQQSIYSIGVLISGGKHKRAIRIAQCLEQQGVHTHQLAVLKSYAISKTQGHGAALRVLTEIEGPLVNVAKAQYNQMMGMNREAVDELKSLATKEGSSYVQQNIHSLEVRLSLPCEKQIEYTNNQHITYERNAKEESCLKSINAITSEFEGVKQQWKLQEISQKEYLLKCQQCLCKYHQIQQEYEPKGRIANTLYAFIDYLERHCSSLGGYGGQ